LWAFVALEQPQGNPPIRVLVFLMRNVGGTGDMPKKAGQGCFGAPLESLETDEAGIPLPLSFLFRHLLSPSIIIYNGCVPAIISMLTY